jgi:hypothetical protein
MPSNPAPKVPSDPRARAEAAAVLRRFLEAAEDLPDDVIAYLRGVADTLDSGAKEPHT